uniref:Uncharacterized protein n=1 Tax=Leersia perrieri TaxID=77586 RepID=A0A0D9XRD8_9ORYZ
MESNIGKVLVEIDDSDVEKFFCTICTDHKSMRNRSHCQGCPITSALTALSIILLIVCNVKGCFNIKTWQLWATFGRDDCRVDVTPICSAEAGYQGRPEDMP